MSTRLKLVPQDSTLDALAQVADSIAVEQEKVEREIVRLAESGFKEQAWKLVVKRFNIKEPQMVKR